MDFAPTRPNDCNWLATTPVEAAQPIGEPCPILSTLILRYLRDSGAHTNIEWVMDAEPGGLLRSWLRAGPVDDGGLTMIGEAAGMPLVSSAPPQLSGCGADTLPIDLGKPVAFLGREPKGVNGFLGRVRWLAERGLGTRLRLTLYPLTPTLRSVQAVQRAREAGVGRLRRWDCDRDRILQAERLLRGLVFEFTLTPDRPLRTAERTLLSQALEDTFTPDAVLGGRRGSAFAEEALAEALVGEFAAACPAAAASAGLASHASGSPAI